MEECLNIIDLLKFSIKGLRSRTLRSVLTLLGILVGVILLTTVLTVSDSVTYSLASIFAKGGLNNIYVAHTAEGFTWADISQIERIPHVVAVSPRLTAGVSINYGGLREEAVIIGLPKEKIALVIPDLEVKEGAKTLTSTYGCFIGSSLASKIEEKGLKIRVGDVIYVSLRNARIALRVEGVLERYGFTFIGYIDESLIVPYDAVKKLIEEAAGHRITRYQELIVTADSVDNVDFITEHLRYLYGKAVMIFAIKDIVKSIIESLRGFTIIIGGIASVTLIVASVGVMNAMFTTVMERTRVIGVLRALGIRRYEVLLNIVLEALILAVVALIIGIPLGVFVGSMLIQGGFLGFRGPRGSLGGVEFIVTNQTLIMVASITLLLTLIGALPPAYRAAKLEPARALRYE
ncbi:MAG: hypothetical protein DRO08_00410 [Thermoprotei archaeon]|nr:MAG: hypothetical protein DRO08_00410 [Thermoprotei archaeon]